MAETLIEKRLAEDVALTEIARAIRLVVAAGSTAVGVEMSAARALEIARLIEAREDARAAVPVAAVPDPVVPDPVAAVDDDAGLSALDAVAIWAMVCLAVAAAIWVAPMLPGLAQ